MNFEAKKGQSQANCPFFFLKKKGEKKKKKNLKGKKIFYFSHFFADSTDMNISSSLTWETAIISNSHQLHSFDLSPKSKESDERLYGYVRFIYIKLI